MAHQFSVSYVNARHMKAFGEALKSENASEVQHITSQNDWAPVNSEILPKLKKRYRRGGGGGGGGSAGGSAGVGVVDDLSPGLTHILLRWPILIAVSVWISFLAVIYAIVRAYVASYEYFFTWRGRRRKLRESLRRAQTYDDWKRAALTLDDHLGFSDWKHSETKSGYYDYKTIIPLVKQLKEFNEKCLEDIEEYRTDGPESSSSSFDMSVASQNIEELSTILQGCVKYNFAGTQGRDLYSQCYFGTKDVVCEYNKQLVDSINVLSTSPFIPVPTKRILFKHFSKNFGKSALCLSGGACFAYRHFGVVKALLNAGLLPKIISGTSGGGLVAALVCTRTNAELDELLVPELADKISACWERFPGWVIRWWKTGARFDSIDWAERCCWFTMGSMTFLEAFQRTGKILNISTVPADPHSPAILCNYITSPHCVIWSALLASAAVPGILNPVVLMMKTRTGDIVPYSFGSKWKDGSFRTDIPIQALNTYFNVTFSVVSQVNPHISLFFYAPRGTVGRPVSRRRGKGWRGGFIGSAIETFVKLEIKKWLQLLKNLKLLPKLNDSDWSTIWLQKFAGTVTVWPKIRLLDFWHILDDPDRDKLSELMLSGERSTYPRLLFIRHFVNIERAIESARKRVSSREIAQKQMSSPRAPGLLFDDSYYHSTSGTEQAAEQQPDNQSSSDST